MLIIGNYIDSITSALMIIQNDIATLQVHCSLFELHCWYTGAVSIIGNYIAHITGAMFVIWNFIANITGAMLIIQNKVADITDPILNI